MKPSAMGVAMRTKVLELQVAVAFSALMLWRGPNQDAFTSTLVILPWIVLAFRRLRVHLGLGPQSSHAWALAAWTVGLPWRAYLGWPHVDLLWAAALVVILGSALQDVLPALRRRLRRDTSVPLVFLAVPVLIHVAILPWALDHRAPDGDEPYYLLLAHSLAYDLDVDLANNYGNEDWRRFMDRPIGPQPADPEGADGQIYSRHNALLPAVAAPFYRLGGRHGVALLMALLASLTAFQTLRVAHRLRPEALDGAFRAWILIAFTPPLLVYSHQIWVEIPAALLLATAVDLASAARLAGGRPKVRLAVALGAVLVLLPLLKLRFLLVAVPLAIGALWPLRRRPGVALATVTALVGAVGAMLAFNAVRYGNPLKMYSLDELGLFFNPLGDYARGALGMFYDSAFGLFSAAPIWLLLLPALWLLGRRRDPWLLPILGLMLPYLAAVAPRLEWYGGWSPAFRYPLVLLPLLAWLLVPLLQRRSAGLRQLVAVLGPLTAALALLWVVVPGWAYHLADGEGNFLHRLGWMLQSDLARLFPSTVRPRDATWIWPLLSLLLVPIAALRSPFLRRHHRRLGLALLLVATAAVPWAARSLPTTVVHWEDGWVAKQGGLLLPPRWTPARPSHVSAWLVQTYGQVSAPVVAGGDKANLRIWVRRDNLGPRTVQVLAGDRELATLTMQELFTWELLEIQGVDWPAGAPLILRIPKGPKPQGRDGIMFDRTEIEWL